MWAGTRLRWKYSRNMLGEVWLEYLLFFWFVSLFCSDNVLLELPGILHIHTTIAHWWSSFIRPNSRPFQHPAEFIHFSFAFTVPPWATKIPYKLPLENSLYVYGKTFPSTPSIATESLDLHNFNPCQKILKRRQLLQGYVNSRASVQILCVRWKHFWQHLPGSTSLIGNRRDKVIFELKLIEHVSGFDSLDVQIIHH